MGGRRQSGQTPRGQRPGASRLRELGIWLMTAISVSLVGVAMVTAGVAKEEAATAILAGIVAALLITVFLVLQRRR